MSILSKFIRTHLLQAIEEEIAAETPELKQVAMDELRAFGLEIINWVESRVHLDLNGDGKIGG